MLFDYSGKMAVLLLAGLEKLFTATTMISQLDLLLLNLLGKKFADSLGLDKDQQVIPSEETFQSARKMTFLFYLCI